MQRQLIWAAPGIFVLLWSTGFIGARLGLPYAEPFSFLFVRYLLVLAILVPIVLFRIKKWPSPTAIFHSVIVGLLLHGANLGGVFFAIDRGMPAGVAALIVSLQPILMLLIAAMVLKEKVPVRTIGLFFMGLIGMGLVLIPGFMENSTAIPLSSLIACIIGLLGISIGTVYQKNYGAGGDLLTSITVQYVGATLLMGLLAYSTETMQFVWNEKLLIAMVWLIFGLSLGAVALLMFLIRRDSVAQTSSLFFLVPGFTMIVAYLLFGEEMNLMQIGGLVLASAAVALVNVRTIAR